MKLAQILGYIHYRISRFIYYHLRPLHEFQDDIYLYGLMYALKEGKKRGAI